MWEIIQVINIRRAHSCCFQGVRSGDGSALTEVELTKARLEATVRIPVDGPQTIQEIMHRAGYKIGKECPLARIHAGEMSSEGCRHVIVLGVGYSGTSTITQEFISYGWRVLPRSLRNCSCTWPQWPGLN